MGVHAPLARGVRWTLMMAAIALRGVVGRATQRMELPGRSDPGRVDWMVGGLFTMMGLPRCIIPAGAVLWPSLAG